MTVQLRSQANRSSVLNTANVICKPRFDVGGMEGWRAASQASEVLFVVWIYWDEQIMASHDGCRVNILVSDEYR